MNSSMRRNLAGRYLLLSEIGSGGMGTVYRARDTRTGHLVAIKVLHPHLARDPAYLERFRREAKIALALDSRHIVQVLDFGHEGESNFLVMEYVDGTSLRRLLQSRRRLPLQDALRVAIQVARALEEAHSKGVVHRDIKPENILVLGDGTVKVADFGIARARDYSTLTVTGAFIGTVQYMAPEVFTGSADFRSDIYSLGIVLYQMLAGAPPFDAPTPWEVMRQHREDVPPPLEERVPGVPGVVEGLVRRCLAKEPDERLQSAFELRRELEALLPGIAEPGGQAAIAVPMSAGRGSWAGLARVPVRMGAGAVLSVVTGIQRVSHHLSRTLAAAVRPLGIAAAKVWQAPALAAGSLSQMRSRNWGAWRSAIALAGLAPPYRMAVVGVLAAAVVIGAAVAAVLAGGRKHDEIPIPDPQQLIRPGATVVESLQIEMIPGEAPVLAVVSSMKPSFSACTAGNRNETDYLELFQLKAFEDAETWVKIMDGSQWPSSGPTDAISPEPDPAYCLPLSSIEIASVRMRSDRDYLVANDTVIRGTGTWGSRLFILGFSQDKLTTLYESEGYPQTDLPDFEISGDQVVYRPELGTAYDPRSVHSGINESVLAYDPATDKVVVKSNRFLPSCIEGTILNVLGGSFDVAGRPIQGGEATSMFALSCGGSGSEYGTTSSTTVEGSEGGVRPGDRVRVTAYRLSAVGELVADKIEVLGSASEYVVQEGDTLYDISERLKLPDKDVVDFVREIAELNNLGAPDSVVLHPGQTLVIPSQAPGGSGAAPPAEPPPLFTIYEGQPGDTICTIAARFGLQPNSLLWNNVEIGNEDALTVGQQLRIPATDGVLHEMRVGETLSDVAARYGVDLSAITTFTSNGIETPDGLQEGQVVFVPGGIPPGENEAAPDCAGSAAISAPVTSRRQTLEEILRNVAEPSVLFYNAKFWVDYSPEYHNFSIVVYGAALAEYRANKSKAEEVLRDLGANVCDLKIAYAPDQQLVGQVSAEDAVPYGCVVRGEAGAPTPTSFALPNRPVGSFTESAFFRPENVHEVAALDGVCWTDSIATGGRPGTFRCNAGHIIEDPCFLFPYDLDYVLCPRDPTTLADDLVIRADFSSYEQEWNPSLWPWFFVTTDGLHCDRFTGTAESTPYGPTYFGCNLDVTCFEPTATEGLWTVECVSTKEASKTSHSIETVWY
jgi:LysM repeat protein/predicted Ser/Thr protein kinase